MRQGISAAFKQNANAQNNPDGIYLLATITHSEIAETHYICNAPVNVVSNGHTFIGLGDALQPTLSEESDDRIPEAQLSVVNVDRRLVSIVRATNIPANVKLQVIQISDPDTIEAELDGFTMKNVSYDAMMIQGKLSLESLFDEPMIDYCFTPTIAPGLFS